MEGSISNISTKQHQQIQSGHKPINLQRQTSKITHFVNSRFLSPKPLNSYHKQCTTSILTVMNIKLTTEINLNLLNLKSKI